MTGVSEEAVDGLGGAGDGDETLHCAVSEGGVGVAVLFQEGNERRDVLRIPGLAESDGGMELGVGVFVFQEKGGRAVEFLGKRISEGFGGLTADAPFGVHGEFGESLGRLDVLQAARELAQAPKAVEAMNEFILHVGGCEEMRAIGDVFGEGELGAGMY